MSDSQNTVLVQRLGEAAYGWEAGHVGALNLLVHSGVPLPEGVILTHEFHHRFLVYTGLLTALLISQEIQTSRRARELQKAYARNKMPGDLNRVICEALIELEGPTVTVVSEDLTRIGLKTIPEVLRAIQRAWLSAKGLKRQIESVSRGHDPPTWPILVQREAHPPRDTQASAR